MRELRFGLVLNEEESEALQALAERERISQSAVLRRLIWAAAQSMQPTANQTIRPAYDHQVGHN